MRKGKILHKEFPIFVAPGAEGLITAGQGRIYGESSRFRNTNDATAPGDQTEIPGCDPFIQSRGFLRNLWPGRCIGIPDIGHYPDQTE